MPKPRFDAPGEDRAKELRKVAAGLRALADKIAANERRIEFACTHGGKRPRRFDPSHAAGRLLMDALALGGPEDESLRRILLSWREDPIAHWFCFNHIRKVWRPLREVGKMPSDILRRIASAVSSSAGE